VNVAFVAPFFGAQAAGGAEHAARSLACQLAAAGMQIEVLTTCLKDLTSGIQSNIHPEGESRDGQILIRRFPVPKADMRHFGLLNDLIIAGTPLPYEEELQFMTRHVTSPRLLQWIADHQSDYDWFCFIPYLFGTTCFGVPVAGEKSITIPCFHDEGYTSLKLVERMVRHTGKFVFNAAAEQRFAQQRFGIPDARCHTVGLGMETGIQGDAERFRRQTGITEPFVLYAGRRDTTKNVHTLIQYFQAFKKSHPGTLKLALIGPAPLPMAAPDPDVIDLGFVSEQEKYDAYSAAAVFCQPSLNESFSYVMMEAWLCNTPCLVHADCAVTSDHVIAANGGFAFRGAAEFAAMLTRLLEDQPLATKLAAQGRQYVLDHYAWPRIIQRFHKDIFTP
jgi:glycosyltransferase involved in cell wall biosynthesis